MPVKNEPTKPAAPEVEVDEHDDPLSAPGFHVLADGSYVGTYVDRDQAESYIEGHLTSQEIKGEVVEGPEVTD